MKTIFESGDTVVYNEEQYVASGISVKINGKDGMVLTKGPDSVVATMESIQSVDSWILAQCIELLNSHAQWEGALTTDDSDSLLESMSTANYQMFMSLQERRNDIGLVLSKKSKND